jgi:uncharacterized heparinase superfamily protein
MNGASLFSGTHYGYETDFAMTHTRRIYLDSKGEDLRGEDILVRNIAIRPVQFTIRFHLHPSVKASVTDNHQSVLLRLPSGMGWSFQSNHTALSLEESIYCADGFHLRKSLQIVINCEIKDLAQTVKWALKKL